jgi:hypothetical protein
MNTITSYIRCISLVVLLILTTTTGTTATDDVDTSSSSSLSVNPLSLLQSTYRDQYQRRLHQIQALQQSHQPSLRDMINALPFDHLTTFNDKKENEKERRLQNVTVTTTQEPLCNSDGTVNFNDDSVNNNIFDAPDNDFDTMCTCFEGTCTLLL